MGQVNSGTQAYLEMSTKKVESGLLALVLADDALLLLVDGALLLLADGALLMLADVVFLRANVDVALIVVACSSQGTHLKKDNYLNPRARAH